MWIFKVCLPVIWTNSSQEIKPAVDGCKNAENFSSPAAAQSGHMQQPRSVDVLTELSIEFN